MKPTPISQRGPFFLSCCVRTIHIYAKKVDCQLPEEGFAMDCPGCFATLVWTKGAWEAKCAWHPDVTAERQQRADEITEGRVTPLLTAGQRFQPPRSVPCQKCSHAAKFVDQSVAGNTCYECANGHVFLVDHSRELGLR